MIAVAPILEARNISVSFDQVLALDDVSIALRSGEVVCLLGDNGAGKSSLIKILAGVYQPSQGEILVDGIKSRFRKPSDALAAGIATVFQDLAMVPIMSVTRNFFLGREPVKGWGPFAHIDLGHATRIAQEQLRRLGININDLSRPVGALSGGQQQVVAIARAAFFGARVLILDEPTSALGVSQANIVLQCITEATSRGLAVVFITHNIHHAYPVANRFTLLVSGRSLGTFDKDEISRDQLLDVMAGGLIEPSGSDSH